MTQTAALAETTSIDAGTTGSATTDAGHVDVDVLVVGAGISGIGAAYHLGVQCPRKTFVVLEALESFGGTWLIHRYPGVRSDSDLYTFGYRFKPWTGPPIASKEEIRSYLDAVIEDNGIGKHIRYHHRITAASWSSVDARWTLEVTRTDTGEQLRFTANFLWMCQGYYRHAEGYTPQWPGMERFGGMIVHPQTWPEDLDVTGKRVVVIGSGATTATLVPAIADRCEHVTVLQRSPTYFWSARNENELANTLRGLEIPDEWTHEIVRRQLLQEQRAVTQLSFDEPELLRDELLKAVRDQLPEGFDVDKHFSPTYRPWQQRLAFVPDGDLFTAVRNGQASMVTDEIETFTETGIRTKGGEELVADIVVTATGFNLSVMGDVPFAVDGTPVDFSTTVTYRGIMCTGVPNMAWIFGYFRASWTLRVDLVGDFVCRLLNHMAELDVSTATPELRDDEAAMPLLPWVDPENFNPNYLMRSGDQLPRRVERPEWQHSQDYWLEKDLLPAADLDDGCLRYE